MSIIYLFNFFKLFRVLWFFFIYVTGKLVINKDNIIIIIMQQLQSARQKNPQRERNLGFESAKVVGTL